MLFFLSVSFSVSLCLSGFLSLFLVFRLFDLLAFLLSLPSVPLWCVLFYSTWHFSLYENASKRYIKLLAELMLEPYRISRREIKERSLYNVS